MPGRNSDSAYRFGFNQKENLDDVKGEGKLQDYGMRIYDPRLGKFLTVDPLRKEYPELTPFQFASNSPIESIDLDGLERISYLYLTEKSTGVPKLVGFHVQKFDEDGKALPFSRQAILDGNKTSFANVYGTEKPTFQVSYKKGSYAFGVCIEGANGSGGVFGAGSSDPCLTGATTRGEQKVTAKGIQVTGKVIKGLGVVSIFGPGTQEFAGPLITLGNSIETTGDAMEALLDLQEENYGKVLIDAALNLSGAAAGKTLKDVKSFSNNERLIMSTAAEEGFDLQKVQAEKDLESLNKSQK